MPATVTLRVKNCKLAGTTYEFDKRRRCMIGRAEDCAIRLPNEPEFRAISRHHSLLDIDPPRIEVHDTASRNGTRINGMQIGRPSAWHLYPETKAWSSYDYNLRESDELQVGDTVFQVHVRVPEQDKVESTEEAEKEPCPCA